MPIRLHTFVSSARHVINSSVFICRFIALHLSPLLIHLSYFVLIDVLGFVALMVLKPSNHMYSPRYVDMFFLSTSAVTVTGLATIKMEDLSSSQIVVLTLLMLLGSEMFVSFLGLVLNLSKQNKHDPEDSRVRSVTVCEASQLEEAIPATSSTNSTNSLKKSCLKYLGFVLLAYMVMILLVGSLLVFLYIAHVSSARDVLTRKSINTILFSMSVTVSSFTNGGLLPMNESMAVFASNQGLLLLLTGQILAGSTLFPVFLRLVIWALRGLRITRAQSEEFEFMMNNTRAVGFNHLLPNLQTAFLVATVAALIAAAVTLFCFLNWDSAVFAGLTSNQKITNALFMAVNAMQAGENSIDCSLVAPAILVLFIVLMYIPVSTTFFPVQQDSDERGSTEDKNGSKKRSLLFLKNMSLPPLACNAALIMLVCITERRSLSTNPLNFSTFNMIFEVISAYGNVGLSTGYSCSRLLQLHPEESMCQEKPYSFSGWWSDQGKLVLVLVMLYGRLKGFHKHRTTGAS